MWPNKIKIMFDEDAPDAGGGGDTTAVADPPAKADPPAPKEAVYPVAIYPPSIVC